MSVQNIPILTVHGHFESVNCGKVGLYHLRLKIMGAAIQGENKAGTYILHRENVDRIPAGFNLYMQRSKIIQQVLRVS